MIGSPDHRRAIALIGESVIVRWPARMMDRLAAASRNSFVEQQTRSIVTIWRNVDPGVRLRNAGVVLVTAAIVHVLVMALQRVPPGWTWLVIPGIAVAQGIVLIVAGSWRNAR